MRPSILFPLFADVRTLEGVGPKLAQLIGKVAGPRIVDVLFHLPVSLRDRSRRPTLSDADEGRIASVIVNVLDHVPRRDPRQPYRVRCSDQTSMIELVFFHGRHEYLARTLPPGSKRLVSGRIERFGSRLQMVHPDYMLSLEQADRLPLFEPVYRLTDGLPAKTLLHAAQGALERLPDLPEWQTTAFVVSHHWPSFPDAVHAAHAPKRVQDIDATAPPRARLAYDELLANQLALALIRKQLRGQKGRALAGNGRLVARARGAHTLAQTPAQEQVLACCGCSRAMSARGKPLSQCWRC
jgi:ATP-dependent DNA helicase RecG